MTAITIASSVRVKAACFCEIMIGFRLGEVTAVHLRKANP